MLKLKTMEEVLKKYNLLFVVLIMAIAVFFRFYDLKHVPPGLYYDEAMNGNNALEIISKEGGVWRNMKVFFPENNGREGLFINIQALFVNYFGNEAWILRIVSAIFGSLTVLGLYLLVKELFFNEFLALSSSFFLATSFWHINFSRIGFRAITAPFFICWGLWLTYKVLGFKYEDKSFKYEDKKNKPFISNMLLSFLAGFIFFLGFHSYISYRVAPLVLIIPIWLLLKNKRYLTVIFYIFGALIAIYPLALYFYQNPQDFFGRTSNISIFSSSNPLIELSKNIIITIAMFFVVGDFNWRHNIAGMPQLWWPLSIFFLLGLIISFKKIIKKDNFYLSYILIYLWFIILLLPVIISNEGLPHALRSIVVSPVVMIFCSIGLFSLIEKINIWLNKQKDKYPEFLDQLKRMGKEFIFLLIAFFILISINTYRQYFLIWANKPQVASSFNKEESDLGVFLKNLSVDNKKYIIANTDYNAEILPMQTLPVMFLTDTYTKEKQEEKKIYYFLVKDIDRLIEEIKKENSAQIFMLKPDSQLRKKLKDAIPNLIVYTNQNILILQK